MKKFLLKYLFVIIYWLFVISVLLVVFVRDSIESELVILIINYLFWYSFGLSSGIFLSYLINKRNKK